MDWKLHSIQIDKMLHNGIIRHSTSPWSSWVILLKKKDGTQSFAVGCRDLNDSSKYEAYLMRYVSDIFDRLGGSTFFSTSDCSSTHWRLPMKETDKELITFVSTQAQFLFNRMPFGLQIHRLYISGQ